MRWPIRGDLDAPFVFPLLQLLVFFFQKRRTFSAASKKETIIKSSQCNQIFKKMNDIRHDSQNRRFHQTCSRQYIREEAISEIDSRKKVSMMKMCAAL